MVDREWQEEQIKLLAEKVKALEPDAGLYRWICQETGQIMYQIRRESSMAVSSSVSDTHEEIYHAWRDAARKLGVF